MKKIASISLLVALTLSATSLKAQEANPSGTVIYSLPNTVISIKAEAVRRDFTAGPYAQYAQKYLGTEAKTSNSVSYTLKSVTATPYIESDPKEMYSAKLPTGIGVSNLLAFSSQGLIAITDGFIAKDGAWRFPSIAGNATFEGIVTNGNLTSATSTLYKTVQTENGFEKVAVQQSQVIEKSLEKKAAETAQYIFDLRKGRMQIITGDTDATFSGEALGAAIAEMTRLEQEYMSLFYGITEESVQCATFDVIPSADNAKQMYVAFRISDSKGLVPANDVSGRAIVLELGSVEPSQNAAPAVEDQSLIYYRIPASAALKVMDGTQMLLQNRIPVYQFGKRASIPVKSLTK